MRWIRDAWKNLSIAKKLYSVVGVMTVLVAAELVTLRFSMNTLSAVRAFVGGEGSWSKAQKNAAISLQRFSITHDEADYQAFLDFLKLPEGDRLARLELQKSDPDLEIVRQGFLQGQIHPDDIDPMVKLLRRFSHIVYLARAIRAWTQADELLIRFKADGAAYHDLLARGVPPRARVRQLSSSLVDINERLTAAEAEFSTSLGEGSRWLESVVISLLTLAVMMVECIGLSLTFFTSRAISRGLADLNLAAQRIGAGDFGSALVVRSRDEIGELTERIGKMGDLLENSYRELEERVRLRTAELETTASENTRLYKEAQSAVHARDEFMSIASHELKTPITSLLLQLQYIQQAYRAPSQPIDPVRISTTLEKSITQTRRLASLLDQLLDLTRIRSGRLQIRLERFDLRALADDLVSQLTSEARRAGTGLDFLCPQPVYVLADPMRINQVLTNLVSNAVKYGDGKPVQVTIEAREDQAWITVRDQGIGIRPEMQAQIFERFERAVGAESSISGLGLGLYIVRQIIDAHGGEVQVRSELGHGSAFTVRLPMRPAHS